MTMIARLFSGEVIGWLAINVLVPLISIPISLFVSGVLNVGRSISNIIADGQIFLASTVLSTSVLYDLIQRPSTGKGVIAAFLIGVALWSVSMLTAATSVHVLRIAGPSTAWITEMSWMTITVAAALAWVSRIAA